MSEPAGLPEEARAALAAGRKVEAIRIVRERLGIGLAEAKALVEGGGVAARPVAAADGAMPAAAQVAIREGRDVEAVRILRQATGGGMKESYEAVKRWKAGNPAPGVSPVQRPSRIGPLAALVALALAALAGWWLYDG